MTKLSVKLKAFSIIILMLIVVSSGTNLTVSLVTVKASPTEPTSNEELLVIDEVNIEAKVDNRFVPLEELISEGINPEFQDEPLPQLLNNTALRINASYSTIIGRSETLVIHQFAVDIYKVNPGGGDTLNATNHLSYYYHPDDPQINTIEFILGPNSSKSEAVTLESTPSTPPDQRPELMLPEYGIYKLVFRVEYHALGVNATTQDSYFYRNITFELVKSYPTPPYVIIYAFFGGIIILLVLIIFGLYGDRKYKQPV